MTIDIKEDMMCAIDGDINDTNGASIVSCIVLVLSAFFIFIFQLSRAHK